MGAAFAVHADYELWERVFITVSTLSAFGSFSVIFTLCYHWKAMVRSKIYPKIILAISLCDFLASFANSWGYPSDPNVCSAQGWLSFYFTRNVWSWSTILACTLAYNLVSGRESLRFSTMFFLCFGTNFIIQCLPYLSDDFYGLSPRFIGCYSCSLGRSYNAEILVDVPHIFCFL